MTRTVAVSAFPSRHRAERAAAALRNVGFSRIWLGATELDGADERVQALDPAERALRWIRVAGDQHIVDALREHGVVDENDVRRIAASIPVDRCVLIAIGEKPVPQARSIVEQNGGTVYDVFGAHPGDEG